MNNNREKILLITAISMISCIDEYLKSDIAFVGKTAKNKLSNLKRGKTYLEKICSNLKQSGIPYDSTLVDKTYKAIERQEQLLKVGESIVVSSEEEAVNVALAFYGCYVIKEYASMSKNCTSELRELIMSAYYNIMSFCKFLEEASKEWVSVKSELYEKIIECKVA